MSEEKVEIVRRHTESWNRRDLTTWLALFTAGAEIDWSRSRGPLKGVYRGHGEHEVFWDAFWSTFEDVQVEYHGFTEVGSEVVVPNTAHMRGRDGIREGFAVRQAVSRRQSRHVMTNVLIDVTGPDTATGRAYLVNFRHDSRSTREALSRASVQRPWLSSEHAL